MKKKVLKNVAILSFALFGLGIIGHNVFADPPPKPPTEIEEAGPDDGGGGINCGSFNFDDHILRLKTCIPLFWQQKLICDTEVNKCCDPTKQKACSGSGWPDWPF